MGTVCCVTHAHVQEVISIIVTNTCDNSAKHEGGEEVYCSKGLTFCEVA